MPPSVGRPMTLLLPSVLVGVTLFGTGVLAQSAGVAAPAGGGTVALPTIDVTALTPLPRHRDRRR